MTSCTNSDAADQLTLAEQLQQHDSDKVRHDIYASLAVIKGFNQALDASFAELCDAYQQLLNEHAGELQAKKPVHLVDLESDCRNCMTRVKSSVERLGTHLDAQERPVASSKQGNCRDAS